MEFVKANYEKILLGSLLVFLAYVISAQIFLIKTVTGGDVAKGGDRVVKVEELPKVTVKVSLLGEEGNSPFLDKNYLYCNNGPCKFIIDSTNSHCPSCGTPVIVPPDDKVGDGDEDKDGMKDEWEKNNGLNPKDPLDAALDTDGDGFTNLEEYTNGKTSPQDSNDHALLATKLFFVKVKKKNMRFVIMSISGSDKTKPKTWDIEVKGKNGGFKRIGDTVGVGVEIVGIEFDAEDESKSKILLSSDMYGVFKASIKKRVTPPKSRNIYFNNKIFGSKKKLIVREGSEFTLKNKKGENPEVYEIKKIVEGEKIQVYNVDLNIELDIKKEETTSSLEGLLNP